MLDGYGDCMCKGGTKKAGTVAATEGESNEGQVEGTEPAVWNEPVCEMSSQSIILTNGNRERAMRDEKRQQNTVYATNVDSRLVKDQVSESDWQWDWHRACASAMAVAKQKRQHYSLTDCHKKG